MECYFCKNNIQEVNFRNTQMLKNFTSGLEKIKNRKKTGTCAYHQRQLSKAIKRARHIGTLSSIPR